MKRSSGFTVIELICVVALLAGASVLFFVQKNALETTRRDEQRKTAINAMHYGLEEVYFANNKSYPRTLDEKSLTSIDPALFTDPNGVKLGQTTVIFNEQEQAVESNYKYEPTGCTDASCTGYSLRTSLENEDDFIKQQRN